MSDTMGKKLTIILSDDMKKRLEDIAGEELRSLTKQVEFMIKAWDDIRTCFYCDKRNECKDYQNIRQRLDKH